MLKTGRDYKTMDSLNIDFDNTLTDPEEDEWAPAHRQEPNEEMIEAVYQAYVSGREITVWTARQWNEAPKVAGWLIAHEVPFHGLMCGKGGSDLYVDDKAVEPEAFIEEWA